uniref:xylulokinase n=1 Tax=Vaginimicrobium propionicum TaxID=1871034 RepID=UPI0012EBB6CD|nr:xylulokinase [Vaginimicrobium propionicum]
MARLVMGVDSSTQSCKVEIRSAVNGELVASGQAPHPKTNPPCSEQNANDWWVALQNACHEALETLPDGANPSDVIALSVGAQCHGLVILDEQDRVIRPVKLWNDTTSFSDNERLCDQIGVSKWISAIGSLPTSAFTISKIAYVARTEPEIWHHAKTILLPHDWLTFKLCGEYVTDRSEASGTGYYDSVNNRYRRDFLDTAIGAGFRPASQLNLPRVLGSSQVAGRLTADAARYLGLRPGILVGAGGGDQHLGALGLGMRPKELAISLGTSGVVFTTSQTPVVDLTGRVNSVADAADGWLPLTCVLNCAKVFDVAAKWLDVSLGELDELASSGRGSLDRPIFVPYLDGERTPNLPLATGSFLGLSGDTTRAELALAMVEGVAFGLKDGYEALCDAGVVTEGSIQVTGGAVGSRCLLNSLADLFGRDIVHSDVKQAVCRGAAVQAAAITEGTDVASVREAWRMETRTVARPNRHARINELLPRYRAGADSRVGDRVLVA